VAVAERNGCGFTACSILVIAGPIQPPMNRLANRRTMTLQNTVTGLADFRLTDRNWRAGFCAAASFT
jgi:hypothetical protein